MICPLCRPHKSGMMPTITDKQRLNWLERSGPWGFYKAEKFQLYQGNNSYVADDIRTVIDGMIRHDAVSRGKARKK